MDAKRGGAIALLERRDIAIPISDLRARINENMAALELQRQEADRQPDDLLDAQQPQSGPLSPAIARPETGWDYGDDHGIEH